jgi:hypothetical protein
MNTGPVAVTLAAGGGKGQGKANHAMFFYIALFAWLGGVVVSFVNGNRLLPTIVLLLGVVLVALTFTGVLGYFGLAGIAILATIIWIANKADTL